MKRIRRILPVPGLKPAERSRSKGSNVCGPFAETGLFTTASGQTVEARQQLGPSGGVNFGSTGWYRTMGSSAYNALEGSLQYTAGRTSVLVSYTYSKSLDNSSAATEQIQPFDPGLEWALSAFNVTHNFVTSYSYQIPFEKAYSHADALTKGWTFSGIARFATGFPVTIAENDDRSLIGNTSVGPTGSADEPDVAPGKVLMQTNPRKGGTYFNTALFTPEILGQFGNAKRRFFGGPGITTGIWRSPRTSLCVSRCRLNSGQSSSTFSITPSSKRRPA